MELRPYGVGTTVYFPLIDFGATSFESTPVTIASGDVKVSQDGGSFTNITSNSALFAHVAGGIYKCALTASEMQGKQIILKIVDQTGTKEWEDQVIIITTNNHASAEIPTFDPTATATAAAVWGAAVATYQTNSTFGKAWADATVPKLAAVTSGIIAADVWNALVASYQTSSTFGKAWADATTPKLAAVVAGIMASDIWNALVASYQVSSSFGKAFVSATTPQLAAIANDAITAAVIATDAIDADAIKTDAVTEIQSGLATGAAVAAIPTTPALASALATAQTAITDIQGDVDNVESIVSDIQTDVDEVQTAVAALPTAVQNADALLSRDVSNTEGAAPVHSMTSMILKLVSRFVATTGRTYRTNGTSVHMTQTPSTDPAADPVTELGVGA